ncbi:hypothetical protein AVDCRST_MAG81-1683 [uncultured Synechococcales cyanobacterium]|uniref:Uncharacterized protein n=1 Tax=uncultured Synechococcales cyanobacterium TaxID=1936017 RepID=A0A6J4V745_9CYAN|nr:hypothetical protein AVDCRST_MAG81-1683 [uncultured Synechococcales cyanobacterium]
MYREPNCIERLINQLKQARHALLPAMKIERKAIWKWLQLLPSWFS